MRHGIDEEPPETEGVRDKNDVCYTHTIVHENKDLRLSRCWFFIIFAVGDRFFPRN